MADSGPFKELLDAVHKDGTGLFDYNTTKIPCIFVKQEVFDKITKACYGKPVVVDSSLNILHDDQKHVFVEIILCFSGAGIEQKILLYANESIEFFERLAGSGMIALAPAGQAGSNIFMVQLPRLDALERSLEMIRSYMG